MGLVTLVRWNEGSCWGSAKSQTITFLSTLWGARLWVGTAVQGCSSHGRGNAGTEGLGDPHAQVHPHAQGWTELGCTLRPAPLPG